MTLTRWHQLMSSWRSPENDAEFQELHSAYSEPHRHYHTVRHIDDCLGQFDEVSYLVQHPEEVEIALWYHDAIYQPRSSSNESDSADWAVRYLDSIGATEEQRTRVRGHIISTQHIGDRLSGDAAVVVDIDVSILGRDPDEYDVYEQAIRKEYRWVPGMIYRRKRIEILESFLERDALYETEHFQSRYEEQARANLRRAIAALRS